MKKTIRLRYSQRISHKFIFMVSIVLIATMGTALYFNHRAEVKNYKAQLELRGKSLGEFIALTSSDAILGQDYLLMDQYMKEISHQPDVVYGVILSADGNNLTSYLNHDNDIVDNADVDNFMETIDNINKHHDIFTMHFPVGGEYNIGSIILGFSTANIDQLSVDSLQQGAIEIGLIIIFLSVCIFLLFNTSILKPIQNLLYSLRSVADGELNHSAKIYSNDELGTLAESFNKMTAALNHMHDEKDSMVKELQTTNTNLEAATKSKSEFLANMSHEIRTPLTAIIGFGNHLKTPDIPETDKIKALNSIVDNGVHLKHIINDILDLSKIEADKLSIDLHEISLFDVFNDIESLFSLQCKERGLTSAIEYSFPLPKKIVTDILRFKQILINLYSNAIKFTPEGSVTIKVNYQQEGNRLFVHITDTGIGLSEDHQQKIFSPFIQADSSTSKKFGGTGLGLSLSLKLAEMLGGTINVESVLDVGSRFSISINPGDINKENLVNEIPIRNELLATESKITARLKSLTGNILLAEDNIHNQELIAIYIGNTSATMDIANDGKEAVEYALEKEYDLILMDMQMPNMDGIEAITILREKGYKKPISALTANAMKHDQNRFYDAGGDDFLSKPIDENLFYLLLEKYLPAKEVNKSSSLDTKGKKIKPAIQRIREKFIKTLETRAAEINDAYNANNWNELKSLLHTLKGVSGNLQFKDIMLAAVEAESCVKDDDKIDLENKIIKLSDAIKKEYV